MQKAVGVLAVLGACTLAHAQSDEGVFSAEGVQLRTDARIHTLFLLFNAQGYDQETVFGPPPLKAARYSEIRAQDRKKLALPEDVTKAADALITAKPLPVDRYIQAALSLADAPKFAEQDEENVKDLKGLSKLLSAAWAGGASEVYDEDSPRLREDAKALMARVEAFTADLRKGLRFEQSVDEALEAADADRVVVIINPLDAHGTQHRAKVGDARVVVLGPHTEMAAPGVLDAVAVEVARMVLYTELKKLGTSAPVTALYTGAGKAAEPYGNAAAYLSEVLSRAVARTVLGRPLVLRQGGTPLAALPGEDALAAELATFAKGKDTLPAVLPALVARATGSAAPAPAPAPAAAPAASSEAKAPAK